eukprot:TRINITY_DN7660_c0_g1_i2.p1 TRINITY_DN7660_c0_g1~~TRINITY_DN7660_c0_g1_i2.p1  ORF type:complete len:272 (+),score=49.77 TRINITY_DN7660_c0_g1_i2:155-970(+)
MSNLDVSLDDLIKKNKTGARGGARGGRGGGRGGAGRTGTDNPYGGGRSGPVRRANTRAAFRAAPYARQPAAPAGDVWAHDLYQDGPAYAPGARPMEIQTGTKLFISNLDYNVSNDDIKELFGELGDLKRSEINFDKSGRSKGTAEVVFARKQDAMKAVSRYDGVALDGKPMKIEIIGTNLPRIPVAARTVAPGQEFGRGGGFAGRGFPMRGRGTYVARGGRNPRGRGGATRGGRGGRGAKPQDTRDPAEIQKELDAELDKYHQQQAEDMAE